jgi:hypothetical protein
MQTDFPEHCGSLSRPGLDIKSEVRRYLGSVKVYNSKKV